MTHALPFTVMLLLLLAVARVFGEILERFGQPAIIGELLAGFLIGPSVFNYIQLDSQLSVISELGVFLLVILAGLEIQADEIKKNLTGRNIWIVVLGFLAPMVGGFLVSQAFKLELLVSLFVGLCVSITALPVSVRILMDLGKLNSVIGKKIIAVAMSNDLIAFLILGIIIDMNGHVDSLEQFIMAFLFVLVKISLFILLIYIVFVFLRWIDKHFTTFHLRLQRLISLLRGKESLFALVIVFVLVFASIAELLGLHFVIGAFFGAVLLNKNILGKSNFRKIKENTSSITMGFLAPIFFAYMGVQFNVQSLGGNWGLLFAVLIAAIAFKVAGGFFGGIFAGMDKQSSFTLGIGLNARGVMELLVANIGLRYGFINITVYSVLVVMGITTTMISPYFLKRSFDRMDRVKINPNS
ncbi:MAG: cation:proton antiporter [Bacteroidota bacterium]